MSIVYVVDREPLKHLEEDSVPEEYRRRIFDAIETIEKAPSAASKFMAYIALSDMLRLLKEETGMDISISTIVSVKEDDDGGI